MADNTEKSASATNLFLFYGEDSFSALEKLIDWKRKFVQKYGDLNLEVLEGGDLTAAELKNQIISVPFLSDKRLVVVMNFLAEGDKDEQKEVLEVLQEIPEFTVVVFYENGKPDARMSLYKNLVKRAKLEEFKTLDAPAIQKWILSRVQKYGGQLADSEARLLLEVIGPNLWLLDSEINKLILYADGKRIDRAMIEKLVSPNPTTTVFKLTDTLGDKQVKEALKTLQILVQSGQELMGVLFMLVRHFRIMAQVKELLEEGRKSSEIATVLKEHPFVISKIIHQARNFSKFQIAETYQTLAEIDQSVKTGKIRLAPGDSSELEQALEVMIVELCRK